MAKMREKAIALLNKYGVHYDAKDNRWIAAEEMLQKCYGIRFDAEEGRWVTTEKDHKIHINGEGVPDKGNPFVLAVMRGEDPKKVKTQKTIRSEAKAMVESHRAKLKELREKAKPLMEEVREQRKMIAFKERKIQEYEKDAEKHRRELEKFKKLRDEQLAQRGESSEEIEKELSQKQSELDELKKWFDDNGKDVYQYFGQDDEGRAKQQQYYELTANVSELTKKVETFEMRYAKNSAERYEKLAENARQDLATLKSNDPLGKLTASQDEYDAAARERNEACLKAYPTPKDCDTTDAVMDYMRAKGYFKSDDDSELSADLKVGAETMGLKQAQALAEHMDKLVEDYPWMKGKLNGVMTEQQRPGAYGAFTPSQMTVTLNDTHYGEYGDIEERYKRTVESGWHPVGTDYASVYDHEMTHGLEELMNRMPGVKTKAADLVMRRVAKRLGRKASAQDQDEIRRMVSEYSADNGGVTKTWDGKIKTNAAYGKNTEWLAEAMAEARCSENPREVAKLVREEFEGLMREMGLEVKS